MSTWAGKGSKSRVDISQTEWELKYDILYGNIEEKVEAAKELVARKVYTPEYLEEKKKEWGVE